MTYLVLPFPALAQDHTPDHSLPTPAMTYLLPSPCPNLPLTQPLNLRVAAGCLGGCGGRGSCVKTDGWYGCTCDTGWDGVNCSIPLEMNCRDGIDNDGGEMAGRSAETEVSW